MLRITRETDYGIMLMTTLVQQKGAQAASATALAKLCRLPVPMVSKILKALAQADLLISQRGAHGGYTLARPAGAISVAEIIEALEGPIALTECSVDEPHACAYQSHCMVSEHWHHINHAIRTALQNISLQQMSQSKVKVPVATSAYVPATLI
jgi:FeS assembly SUF system regulator